MQNAMYIKFPLVLGAGGTPCIIGNTYDKFRSNTYNLKVWQSDGRKAPIYQRLPDKDKVLFKVAIGTYIGVYDSNIHDSLLTQCHVVQITSEEIIAEVDEQLLIQH